MPNGLPEFIKSLGSLLHLYPTWLRIVFVVSTCSFLISVISMVIMYPRSTHQTTIGPKHVETITPAEQLREGLLRFGTAAAMFSEIEELPIVQQKELIQNYYIGRHVRWPVKINRIEITSSGFEIWLLDDASEGEYGIWIGLNRDWARLVEQLKRGDKVAVSGEIKNMLPRFVFLEGATVELLAESHGGNSGDDPNIFWAEKTEP